MGFRLVRAGDNRVDIVCDQSEIGFIIFSEKLPEFVLGMCNTNDEVDSLIPYTSKGKSIHLEYITIHSQFRGAGYAVKALDRFINCIKYKGFTSINLLSNQSLLKIYKSIGFKEVTSIRENEFTFMELTFNEGVLCK